MTRTSKAARKANARRHGPAGGAPMIRSATLSHYAQVASSMKLDVAAMLKRVGLDTMCLVDPNVPIPAIRVVQLIECSAIEASSPDFGIRLALARGVPDLGPLNLLLREEPNLRSALRSLQSYLHLHSRSIRFSLQEQGDRAILQSDFATMVPMPLVAPQSTEFVVCGVLQVIRWLVGTDWSPTLMCVTHAASGDTKAHRSLLRCRLEFGQAFNGVVLTRADLDRLVTHSNPLLRKYAEQYVRTLAGASSSDFQEKVTELVAALLPTGRCSVMTVARHLGMDRSTLGRRLAQVNQSYSSVLQTTRVRLAGRSCLSGWPLADVADQLGFADLSTFSRWFTKSFGCSAKAWRRTHTPPTRPSA